MKSDGSDIVLEALLQRAFIKSKAIDVEALCIYTGKRVWRLKVPIFPCSVIFPSSFDTAFTHFFSASGRLARA